MQKVLKKSRRTSSTQLPRSSPKKSLRSWRCVEQIFLLVWFFFHFCSPSTGGEGGRPYERRTVTLAVNDPAIHTDITFFIKRS